MAYQVWHIYPELLGVYTVCSGITAQQLRIGEDLLQSVVVANAKSEDGLSWVAGKMPGYASREGQHHLPCDLHNTFARVSAFEVGIDGFCEGSCHWQSILGPHSEWTGSSGAPCGGNVEVLS